MKNISTNARVYGKRLGQAPIFDGTAALKLDQQPACRVVQIDRRAGRSHELASVKAQQQARVVSAKKASALEIFWEGLGLRYFIEDLREGSLAGKELPGATPGSMALFGVVLTIIGIVTVVL